MIDIVFAGLMAVLAVAILWVGRPATMARVGPNPLIGMRTSATMRSSAAWASGHRAAWPWLVSASTACIACMVGAVLLRLAGQGDVAVGSVLIGGVAALGLFAIAGAVAADKAAKRVSVDE